MGSWLKEATKFVRSNQALLTTRRGWLFSSGPLGGATKDAEDRDLFEISEPKELHTPRCDVRPSAGVMVRGSFVVTIGSSLHNHVSVPATRRA